ncbi:MAG: hypothetical protein PUF63_05315 [Prevotella sp.]|jgi:hypothetical protein|nr:hypothetical protein [Prevotella sp.]
MLYLLLSLVALGLISALIGYISYRRGDRQEIIKAQGDCTSCSGSNAMCEQECTMKAATEPIEYFDDEELDTFRGRPSDSYTEEETQQFADVLETLQPNEVKPWGRSLILRGINMPDSLKDEFAMLAEA